VQIAALLSRSFAITAASLGMRAMIALRLEPLLASNAIAVVELAIFRYVIL
jgi:hypothetical protein